MPQMLHEHFACARSGPFPFRSRSVPRSVFGPAFPDLIVIQYHILMKETRRRFAHLHRLNPLNEMNAHPQGKGAFDRYRVP